MSLPKLLRRLEHAAAAGDERTMRDTMVALAHNDGWSRDVETFIARMPSSARSNLDEVMNPPGSSLDRPGGDYRGGSLLRQATWGTWTMDATSGVGVPANATEWANAMAAAGISSGGPSFLWGFQDASGNIADSLSTATLTAAALTYQQPVSGWSRKAVTFTDSGGGQCIRTSAPVLDAGAASQLVLGYGYVSMTSTTRALLFVGSTTTQALNATTTSFTTASSTTASGSAALGSTVRPLALLSDVTNSRVVGYNESDKMTPTYRAGVGVKVDINCNATGGWLYAVAWQGAAAELTDAQIKRLLQTLGWTITWN